MRGQPSNLNPLFKKNGENLLISPRGQRDGGDDFQQHFQKKSGMSKVPSAPKPPLSNRASGKPPIGGKRRIKSVIQTDKIQEVNLDEKKRKGSWAMTYEEEIRRKEAYDRIKSKMQTLTPTGRDNDDDSDSDDYNDEFKDDYQTKSKLSEFQSNLDPATFRQDNEHVAETTQADTNMVTKNPGGTIMTVASDQMPQLQMNRNGP